LSVPSAALPRLVLAALIAGALAFTTLAPAAPADAGMGRIIDFEEAMAHCETQQLMGPDAYSTSHVPGPAPKVSLDALVLVDVAKGAQIARMVDPEQRAAAEKALFDSVAQKLAVGKQSYADLDIDLRYDDFALLQPLNVDGSTRTRTTNAQEIINLGKAQLGGARPAGIDVVYVVTDLDIQLPSLGNAVAGLADCIGGVGHADRAFAVGEMGVLVPDEGGIKIGPIAFYKDLTAKIAAHEIGHLMGGHHHYQECGTAAGVAVQRGEPGPCTLMTNAVDFQTLPFSNLNGLIVRGHAEKYAKANDVPAGESHSH
jgi:hypothetical protein